MAVVGWGTRNANSSHTLYGFSSTVVLQDSGLEIKMS